MPDVPGFQLIALRGAFGGFRDDNFLIGWSVLAGSGAITVDYDDIATLSRGAGTSPTFAKTVPNNLLTNTWKYLIVRGKNIGTNTIQVAVIFTDASTSFANITSTVMGFYSIALAAGKQIANIQLLPQVSAINQNLAAFDGFWITTQNYVDLSQYFFGDDDSTYLGWQVGDAMIRLRDEIDSTGFGTFWGGNNNLTPGTDIIQLYTTVGTAEYVRIYAGQLVEKNKESHSGYRVTTLRVNDWNNALRQTETYVSQVYGLPGGGATDKAIVEGLIGLINTGHVVPSISGWNIAYLDGTTVIGASGITNAAFTWNQVDVNQAMQTLSDFVAFNTSNSPQKGNDFYVSFSEAFSWFPIGLPASSGTVSDIPTANDFVSLNLNHQITTLKTEVSVIGTIQIPPDGDAWTETQDVWTNEAVTQHNFQATGTAEAGGLDRTDSL